ncbi:MAG: hypothetical protein QM811_25875 [Pirellulales bacterium]
MVVKPFRAALIFAAVVWALSGDFSVVWAQLPAEPPILIPPENPGPPWPSRATLPFTRGGGFYYSLVKIGFLLVTFWIWVKLTDFLAQDVAQRKENYALWNPIFVGSVFRRVFIGLDRSDLLDQLVLDADRHRCAGGRLRETT